MPLALVCPVPFAPLGRAPAYPVIPKIPTLSLLLNQTKVALDGGCVYLSITIAECRSKLCCSTSRAVGAIGAVWRADFCVGSKVCGKKERRGGSRAAETSSLCAGVE